MLLAPGKEDIAVKEVPVVSEERGRGASPDATGAVICLMEGSHFLLRSVCILPGTVASGRIFTDGMFITLLWR